MDNPYKRSFLLLVSILLLLPILLGGFANMERGYRSRWMALREDHLRRIREGRLEAARRAETEREAVRRSTFEARGIQTPRPRSGPDGPGSAR